MPSFAGAADYRDPVSVSDSKLVGTVVVEIAFAESNAQCAPPVNGDLRRTSTGEPTSSYWNGQDDRIEMSAEGRKRTPASVPSAKEGVRAGQTSGSASRSTCEVPNMDQDLLEISGTECNAGY